MILFIAIPEMYAYTFMILYDYSNAIFFAIGVYFTQKYFEKRELNVLIFSALMMGIATYIRSETLYFVAFGAVLLFLHEMKYNRIQAIINCFYFLFIPFLFYAIWFFVFMKFYMPVSYDVAGQINSNIFDWNNFYELFKELNKTLIFGKNTLNYYSHFIGIFLISTIANFIIFRNTSGWQLLAWVLILYLGYAILIHLLPSVVIDMSVKRGFFKLFPIMLIYFSYNRFFLWISEKIYEWEYR